ncbi:MAG: type II/IV secretion system protein [Myxococcales bacterium]|nr:type II/IV secretion system protein [Myxococcales bacterium]
MAKKIRIGELLVQNEIITTAQLEHALRVQRTRGRRLGRTLIDLGYVEEDELLSFLAQQLEIPFIDLRLPDLSRDAVLKLPETHARRFRALVVEDTGNDFLVGMIDPMDIFAVDELSRILGKPVRLGVVRETDLVATIDRLYRRTEEITSLAEELHEDLSTDAPGIEQLAVLDDTADAPVMRFLRSLFEDAARSHASDIHIEPDDDVLRIRQRVDGVLNEQVMKESRIASAVVLRLKLMAGLDISEKRLPQDGSFSLQTQSSVLDVRLSTMPIQSGESVVLRLLDQAGESLVLDQLGMPETILKKLNRILQNPHGLILVTGPTGSGKTTTLYAALRQLNTPEKKIITVEDPVEYRLPRINQVQVHPQIGLTFARVLRSALRQDPDILMIGEIRDQETAEIGLRAAITGHLVLSTIHTNDAVTSGPRLVDMGAEPYLAASALRAVIAQRLIRRVCESCKETHVVGASERVWVTALAGAGAADREYARGRGCTQCNGTGYRGRIGVYELLELDPQMADALRQNDQVQFIRLASESMETLAHCALDYALQGITSLTEVFRVAEEVTDVAGDAATAVPPAPETPVPLDSGPAALDPDSVVV